VIAALTELVEAAHIEPVLASQSVMRRVILWCVEGYFGHLGGGGVQSERDGVADARKLAATP
jgi:hypothetical protein